MLRPASRALCNFPVIKYGKKGIAGSLIALSVFAIPFLYALHGILKIVPLLLPVGIRMSAISIAYLWIVFGLFKLLKLRELFASAVSLLLAIPVHLLINYTLSKMIGEPLFDIWDMMTFSIIIAAAVALFIMDRNTRKKKPS